MVVGCRDVSVQHRALATICIVRHDTAGFMAGRCLVIAAGFMAGPPGHPLTRAVLVHALETSADLLNKKNGYMTFCKRFWQILQDDLGAP